jgi:DNA-binding transcriptional ArsR family regulator
MNGRQRVKREGSYHARATVLLGVLAGDVRFEIIGALARQPRSVNSLAEDLELSVSHISHNLHVLLDHGLVTVRPDKKLRIYELASIVQARLESDRLAVTVRLGDFERIQINTLTAPSGTFGPAA